MRLLATFFANCCISGSCKGHLPYWLAPLFVRAWHSYKYQILSLICCTPITKLVFCSSISNQALFGTALWRASPTHPLPLKPDIRLAGGGRGSFFSFLSSFSAVGVAAKMVSLFQMGFNPPWFVAIFCLFAYVIACPFLDGPAGDFSLDIGQKEGSWEMPGRCVQSPPPRGHAL